MNVLVLNRFPLSDVRYRDWLGPESHVRVITAHDGGGADWSAGFDESVVLEDYDSTAMVEYHAHRWHRLRPFDLIVAMSEYDILRAARLREAFGLPGQDVASAVAFRDKVVMKDHWRSAGVPATPHREVTGASDLLDFVARHGFPVVVKPRLGSGSRDVHVLCDDDELRDFLPHLRMSYMARSSWMVEEFVSGTIINVDGVLNRGVAEICWPSESTLSMGFQQGEPTVCAGLEPDDPRTEPIRALVRDALRALPCPDLTIFHAEVWECPDGTLLMNEIGSRMGGHRLRETIDASFGVDMIERAVRGQADPRSLVPAPPDRPVRQAGYAWIMPIPGVPVAVPPRELDLPGLVEYETRAVVGRAFRSAESSGDWIGRCVIAGPDRAQVDGSLTRFVTWFTSNLALGEELS